MIIEDWKPVLNYESLYEVSTTGSIRSVARKCPTKGGKLRNVSAKTLKPVLVKGYHIVNLHKDGVMRQFRLHRLIAEAFIPNPQNLGIVNHLDGNKTNNHMSNLEWCTVERNNTHAAELGLLKGRKGEQHHGNTLTENIVRLIKNALTRGVKGSVLASTYNVSQATISNIKHNKNWNHI